MGETVIETDDLSKVYGDTKAVEHLNLEIERGKTFGLLGPNGSGKTTIFLLLLGMTEPTSGECKVLGFNPLKNPIKIKESVGYLPENSGCYKDLTARENLEYIMSLNDIPKQEQDRRVAQVMEMMGLEKDIDSKVRDFSKGMERRLAIASLLIKDPKIVFLDEPTAGLDPRASKKVLDLIINLKEKMEVTFVCASHLLNNIRKISDRVGMMKDGKLVADESINDLEESFANVVRAELSEINSNLLRKIKDIDGVKNIKTEGNAIIIESKENSRAKVSREIVNSGTSLLQLTQEKMDLYKFYRNHFE